jgi:hypothetical protein
MKPESPAPTFDEWFKSRNAGASFESLYMQPGQPMERALRALSKELRDYVSETCVKLTL